MGYEEMYRSDEKSCGCCIRHSSNDWGQYKDSRWICDYHIAEAKALIQKKQDEWDEKGRSVWLNNTSERIEKYKCDVVEFTEAERTYKEYMSSVCDVEFRQIPIKIAAEKYKKSLYSNASNKLPWYMSRLKEKEYNFLKVSKPKHRWICCGNILDNIDFIKHLEYKGRVSTLHVKVRDSWKKITLTYSPNGSIERVEGYDEYFCKLDF
uniref:Uncharacterized protein n=1 Tax=Pithovirus LCPAC406 TaxID=2506599 RepID=A0A481ZFA7_9VIRU|nr:MAG: hypothetical protein LCPAC406_01560 [Pithovirus LCPAC406]